MKEQKLIEMQNKVEAVGRVLQQIINEMENLKTLVFGNHQVMQRLSEYKEIIEQLQKEQDEQKTNTSGDATGDQGITSTNLELE